MFLVSCKRVEEVPNPVDKTPMIIRFSFGSTVGNQFLDVSYEDTTFRVKVSYSDVDYSEIYNEFIIVLEIRNDVVYNHVLLLTYRLKLGTYGSQFYEPEGECIEVSIKN